MNLQSIFRAILAFILLLAPAALLADTNCEEGSGPLNNAQLQGITQQEIIQKFTAREEVFRQASLNYSHHEDITVQELDGTSVTGTFRLVQDVGFNGKGERIENVTFAPQSELRQLSLGRDDWDDIRTRVGFFMTGSDAQRYNFLYIGMQHIDEIEAYVFDVAPKAIEKGQRYFQGRIWVDKLDFTMVKSCGKSVPETIAGGGKKKKNMEENLSPKFVTYREQIDGYWFPTYIRSDDTLHFRFGDIQMREIIKLTAYKRLTESARTALENEAKQNPRSASKKP
jgi:hypothetical protein